MIVPWKSHGRKLYRSSNATVKGWKVMGRMRRQGETTGETTCHGGGLQEYLPEGRGGSWGGARCGFHSEVTESYEGWAWSSHFPFPKFFLIT